VGGSLNDLENILTATINAFNAHDMATVQQHLAPDAVVVSIGPRPHSPNAVAKTFTAQTPKTALQAINDEFNEKSMFWTVGQVNYTIDPAGNNATITGAAHWTDDNGTDHIKFVFECIFDPNRNWLFKTISATG
jgi:ketosteroid isomerase-like protein